MFHEGTGGQAGAGQSDGGPKIQGDQQTVEAKTNRPVGKLFGGLRDPGIRMMACSLAQPGQNGRIVRNRGNIVSGCQQTLALDGAKQRGRQIRSEKRLFVRIHEVTEGFNVDQMQLSDKFAGEYF